MAGPAPFRVDKPAPSRVDSIEIPDRPAAVSFAAASPVPRKRILLYGGIAAAALLVIVMTSLLWSARREEVARAPADAPLIKAGDQPIKVPPESPGGLDVPNRDILVYRRMQGTPGERPAVERLQPGPEQPLAPPAAPPRPAQTSAPVSPPVESPLASGPPGIEPSLRRAAIVGAGDFGNEVVRRARDVRGQDRAGVAARAGEGSDGAGHRRQASPTGKAGEPLRRAGAVAVQPLRRRSEERLGTLERQERRSAGHAFTHGGARRSRRSRHLLSAARRPDRGRGEGTGHLRLARRTGRVLHRRPAGSIAWRNARRGR